MHCRMVQLVWYMPVLSPGIRLMDEAGRPS